MKIHDVFPPGKLQKVSDDLLPGQLQDKSFSLNITGEDKWEVEELPACRLRYGKLAFWVTWLNHDIDLTYAPTR